MKIKSITFLLSSSLLFMLTVPAIAWDCVGPPPGDCYECVDGRWVRYGTCWDGCWACTSCVDCWCEIFGDCWPYCPDCESCINCLCECSSLCCEDDDCGPPGCWNCTNCQCGSQCDPSECEDCLGDTCQVCGGHPGIVCCGGECCDTSLCKECVEGECVDKCDYDNCELCGAYGNCFSECDADECCDNDTCVDKCDPDGDYCYFTWPPLETPPTGCWNPDPTSAACESFVDGAICAWVQTTAYHLDSAKCAECKWNCKHPSGDPCVELTPWKCNNDLGPIGIGLVCNCNDDETTQEDAIDIRVHFECN